MIIPDQQFRLWRENIYPATHRKKHQQNYVHIMRYRLDISHRPDLVIIYSAFNLWHRIEENE